MTNKRIIEIVNRVQPLLRIKYNSDCSKVELHNNIYERLSGIEGMTGEYSPHGEYDWKKNKIYLYVGRMTSEEQVIKTLIHETVHSTQSKVEFDYYYNNGCTYENHPLENEARFYEKYWKNYELKELELCQEK